MGLIVLPEGTQRSGSTGGTTYSRNRFGAYTRNRSVPVNPNTSRQVAVRNDMRSLAIAWDTVLTQVQRDAWNVYAANVSWTNKLGQTVNLTGLNHFIRSNTPRLGAALVTQPAAPGQYNLATAELSLGASASEATQVVSVTYDAAADWASEDGAFQQMAVGRPVNGSIAFFGGPYRIGATVLGDSITPPTSPEAVATPFPFTEGNRIWVRTRIGRADGRLSEFAEVNFLGAV